MRKFILLFICILLLTSCKTTIYCTPEEDYIQFVKDINAEILSRGYTPVSCTCDTQPTQNVHWNGYVWYNDRVFFSNYVFANGNDTIDYTFGVNHNVTNMGDLYVDTASVVGCRVTNDKDKDLCNSTSMQKLSNPPKRNVRYTSEEGILAILIGIPAALAVAFLAFTAINNRY